jgi:glycosidase
MKLKTNLTLGLALLFLVKAYSQKITFDPVDWKPDQPVTIKFDFTATSLQGATSLYFWSWFKNAADQTIDSPNNGAWTNSSAASQLTNLGNNQWSITITPNTYLGINSELLKIGGFNFLIKNLNGSQKTEDYGPVTLWADNGMKPTNCWWSKRKITMVVDVTGTALAGNAGPLHYWGWYNTGSSDVGAAQNGSWGASSPQSQMTQVATNVWKIDLDAPTFFGTSASNLSASTIFGLIKTANGSAQTGDFGKNKTFKQYHIYQSPLSRVMITPSNPADNVPVTVRFTAVDDLVGYTDRVYLHTGVTTSAAFSENWDKSPTNWDDTTATAPNLMTNVGLNQWEFTIPSIRSYYGLSVNEIAFKTHFRIRTKLGGFSEGDGCQNATIQVNNANYLEVREPVGTILTRPLNEPFRITAYSPLSSNFTISVNGSPISTQNTVNRATTTFIPTTAGTYTIQINSTNGSNTITKTLSLTVCNSTSIASPVSLPNGLKYGINYDNTDATKATLVLHAPTENIKTVHVIGDFNNWTTDCNYVMNWDNVKKVFWKTITGLTAGQEYVFQYLIDGKTRVADSYTDKVSDPWNDNSIANSTFPSLIQYPEGAKPKYGETPTIASVLRTNKPVYNWQVTNFNRPSHNKLNVYQLHFRDFTPEGTYQAAIQKLDYLKRMGVNAIETLPVSEFEGNNSWGYNPNFYFAADKAYGTENDYKQFVDECHKRGIAVLGDIVLNHAFGTNPMARMYWNDLNSRPESNNPWFNQKTNFANPAANWGNDFNHQSTHTQAFVDSVIHYWMTEFKIDGIRFDFTKGFGNTPYPNASCGDEWGGCYDAARIALLKRMATKMWTINNGATGSLPIVIMEHLATIQEDKELADFGIVLWSGVSPNYKYSEIAMGYAPTVADPNKSNISEAYYKNKTFLYANWKSYMESHDEERLAYKAKMFGNGNVQTDLAVRSQFLQNAAVMNLLLTGPRMVWQFGELGYDFSIDYNQRTGRKPVRWDYYDVPERRKIYDTYSKLYWLRNNLPNTFHRDIDNPGGTKTDFVSQFKRYHFYNAVGDTSVTIIANTANSVVSGNPQFNGGANDWYEYFTGQTHNFPNPASASITLQPGEFRIYFNRVPTQNAPQITLTAMVSATVGYDSTDITLKFDKEIERIVSGSPIGEKITASNITNVITLQNSSNQNITFTGGISFDNRTIRVTPNATLPVGSYTITLLPNTIQNFGGLKITNPITLTFTIIESPCQTNKTYSSPSDDFNAGNVTKLVSNNIQATNKITNTARVEFDAKKYVLLNAGFMVTPASGGAFVAKIGGCD